MHPTAPTPRSRVLAGALIAAPLLLLASTVAYVLGDGLGDGAAGGAIQVYAGATLGLALLGLLQLLDEPLPRLAAILTVTGAIGVAGAVGFGIDSMVFALDPTVAITEQETSTAAFLGLLLPGLTFPLTLAACGIGLLKAQVVARPSAVLVIVGAVLFPVSRIGEIAPLALAVDALLLAGLGSIGLQRLGRWTAASAASPARADALA